MAREDCESKIRDGEAGSEGRRAGGGIRKAGWPVLEEVEGAKVTRNAGEGYERNRLDFSRSRDARGIGRSKKDCAEDEGKRGAVGGLSERAEGHHGIGCDRGGTEGRIEGCEGSGFQRDAYGAEVCDSG